MTKEEIQAAIDKIRQDRAEKGGRMSNAEKAQIESLEAMLTIPEEPALEGDDMETTTETPEQADTVPEAPAEAPSGNGRVTARNLTVPLADGLKNVPEGTVVDVPDEFLAAMIEAGRMEKV